jgi:hypothetical protein
MFPEDGGLLRGRDGRGWSWVEAGLSVVWYGRWESVGGD